MKLHAFVAMPFGKKNGPDGQPIFFNRIYAEYIKPALEAAGLAVFRADEEQSAGDIRSDMFQELLIADLVLADLTIDNPNVWYELGVRHALRARGVVLVQGPREGTPFDIYTDRKLRYHLKDGAPDPDFLAADIAKLAEMAQATLASWHGRKISPVYRLVDNLQEPDWKQLKVGDAREFWERHAAWELQVKAAQRSKRPGDVLVLAEETPVVALRANARLAAGEALLAMERYKLALEEYDACLDAEPGHVKASYKRGVCLQRLGRLDEARDHYRQLLAARPQDAEAWALLGRIDKDAWVAAWNRPGATPAQMADDA
ncbi:tetratricopeptide repeat protein, partial [Pseudorhodoferax sp.]|uniref:tetratricopeptide repeat protein n=1 Tax=Pseudorhodoferax sp. TaxID=1993553 RepID=UPI002DD63C32